MALSVLPPGLTSGSADLHAGAPASRARRLRLSTPTAVLLLAALSVLARVPSMFRPLSPDEGGFLMVAAQWATGTSLYGDYWVDRPPLLIMLFQLADQAGADRSALRLLGDVSVGSSVLLAAALARAAIRLGAASRAVPGSS